MHGFVQYK